jgi:hypothetical protein
MGPMLFVFFSGTLLRDDLHALTVGKTIPPRSASDERMSYA